MKGSTVYLSLFLAFVCRTLLLLRLSSLYVLVPLCLQHLRRIHHDSPVDVHFPSQVPLKNLGSKFGRCWSVRTMYITVPQIHTGLCCVYVPIVLDSLCAHQLWWETCWSGMLSVVLPMPSVDGLWGFVCCSSAVPVLWVFWFVLSVYGSTFLYAGEKRTAMLPHALAVALSNAIRYSSLSLCRMPSVRPHFKRNACKQVCA